MKNTAPKHSQGKTLFLIDGNSFCYRAFYAIPALTNSKGEPTNAIYGFITMLRKLIEGQSPDYLAVCFDRKEPTFRHEKYQDYKAHRKPMPEELVRQIEPIKEFCRLSNIALFEKAGYEADDVIGTLAVCGKKEGLRVFIATSDKDAFQLVDDQIKIIQPHKDNLIFDVEKVRERFSGLGPESVVDILALMGDASDNIPGVPGIGEKTAIKLIQEFGSVDNLLKNSEKIPSQKQREKIQENLKDLKLSQELAAIDTAVPLEIRWVDIGMRDADHEALTEFFKRYEFRGLLKETASQNAAEEKGRDYRRIKTDQELKALAETLKKAKAFSFDTETTSSDPMMAELVGMSFSWEPLAAHYVPVSCGGKRQEEKFTPEEALKILRPVLEDPGIRKYGQNIKYDGIVMARAGVHLAGIEFDTMIASYLIDPLKRNHNLDDISLEYLNVKKIPTESLLGKGAGQITMDKVPLDTLTEYACEDADCVFRLVPLLKEKMKKLEIQKLFEDMEMPLAAVLGKMEMNGVALDLPFLKRLSDKAAEEIETLEKDIYQEAGKSFNLDSPKQLAEILFVHLKLPPSKKTKTGYSTDASVLEKLAASYELPRKVLEYRERSKLKSTYLDALPKMVNPETHCVHTSYNQTTTDTGRLSSSDPNLQNIPIRSELGHLVRKAFIPRKRTHGKGKILSADYSQIELRLLAHFSEDPNLIRAFEAGRDIHAFTATLLYGVPEAEVTREMRNAAKTINFSIVYGKTSYGLSQDLNISIQEADRFIKDYFARYPRIKDFLEGQKEKARKNGFLTTLLGRRAYFPNIHASNMQLRQYAERAAINAPLQGSAADLIKMAMVAIQARLDKKFNESLMIMQVHDELVFDVPERDMGHLEAVVREEMEKVYKLKVPLQVGIAAGDSWYKD